MCALPQNASPRGLDLPSLERFFSVHVPEHSGPLQAELLFGGRSNLTYRVWDDANAWVLRRPPLGGLTPSAHDMGREFRVVAALQGTAVPVARTVALCEDLDVLGAPFSVVSHVDGRVIRSTADLADLAQAEVDRCAFALVDVLADLHAVDVDAIGLGALGRPEGYLTRQVARWFDQWGRVATEEVPDVGRLHERLRADTPVESGHALVHGDLRIDNAIVAADDVGDIRALVDWEMATLGDPLADLGLHLVYRDPLFEPVLGESAASTSDRMPAIAALASRYATASGRDVSRLAFYVALGYFKTAVIAAGIWARYQQGASVGEGYERVGEAIPGLAAAGLRTLDHGIA
ncbi:MAG: putative acyl-CoA dehydrogenase [Frankiales bacterium]|nr:putative acyl-CoA dehydrogenase [Frankiales bacterium]